MGELRSHVPPEVSQGEGLLPLTLLLFLSLWSPETAVREAWNDSPARDLQNQHLQGSFVAPCAERLASLCVSSPALLTQGAVALGGPLAGTRLSV